MLPADWFIPQNVALAFSERMGGVSQPPFDSLNLGDHVGDAPQAVAQNRHLLCEQLGLIAEPVWLNQVHGTEVIDLDGLTPEVLSPAADKLDADASICSSPQHVCVVMTADCLPVLICDRAGTQVAAVHAGWRGLCNGIIEAAIARFKAPAAELCLYLGPCIGAEAFEVGAEVRQAFIEQDPQTQDFFTPRGDKYLGDLQGIARYRAAKQGVIQIFSLDACTYQLSERFFSYRRESVTGRMASLIWLKK
ncbi:peptidoglycan editing factor PgeF [Shewanella sp. AS1]|uniref:peptidoglycan editing factor PgeF n=1 Tax=Shewanella sp. AS1 TaxID=2907626 RepID=UPI001F478BD1|nr:peptidoglycan editing factor PgeF [Shewanella sp. AS1]MCE9680584.1 peptidoglycan editing factor PgeF [Shewanella sp. AS1]